MHAREWCVFCYYLDEGKGASTRPDSKQVIERTVIELRYGILDKIEKGMIPEAKRRYDITKMYFDDKIHRVDDWVPDYQTLWKHNRG